MVADERAHRRADDGVEPRTIAAAGEDADAFHGAHLIKTVGRSAGGGRQWKTLERRARFDFRPADRRLPTADSVWHSLCSTVPRRGQHVADDANWRKTMNFIGWILFGLVVGAIAKFFMPGRDPGGWIVTILLGIAGSFVGRFPGHDADGTQKQSAGWIGSIIGAIVLLFIYRLIVGRRAVA